MRCVFDISEQVFDSYFLCVCGADAGGHMCEVTTDVAFLVDFLLGEESLSRQTYLLILLNIADNKYRVCVVAANNLINLNIVALDFGPG